MRSNRPTNFWTFVRSLLDDTIVGKRLKYKGDDDFSGSIFSWKDNGDSPTNFIINIPNIDNKVVKTKYGKRGERRRDKNVPMEWVLSIHTTKIWDNQSLKVTPVAECNFMYYLK